MRLKLALGAAAALMTTLTACGGTDGSAGADSGLSVTIAEPVSGASVSVPFTVKVDSSVPLGPSESGKHHVHIWFDDNEADYLIVESDTIQITEAPAGQRTMHVSLRNANHSAAGAEASTPLVVAIGPGGSTPAPSPTSDPYGY